MVWGIPLVTHVQYMFVTLLGYNEGAHSVLPGKQL